MSRSTCSHTGLRRTADSSDGASTVWRWTPSDGFTPTVWATGLTAVTGCGFGADGKFYAVEFSTLGFESFAPFTGALVQVDKNSSSPTTVVDSLSWTFAADRFHVVAGPSGSGKTTILNLQAALDYPDAGEIWVGGDRIESLNADEAARFRRRMLGYVSQHSTLVDFLSARENVELALTLRGLDARPRVPRSLCAGALHHQPRVSSRLSRRSGRHGA